MKNTTKKLLALLVVFILCLGVCQAAFDAVGPQVADKIISAIGTDNADEEENYESPVSSDKYYSREELEAFADKAGGDKTHEEIIEMSDKELGDYIEENLKDTDFSDIVNAVDPTDKESVEQNRDALEEIADILGCDTEEIENMDNSELLEFVEDKIESEGKDKEDAPVVNLDKKEDKTPVSDIVDREEAPEINDIIAPSENEEDERNDNYNENGELNGTFDELYPELMETEEVEYDDETVLVKLPADFDGKITKEMKSAGVKALELLFALDEYSWYEAFVKKGTDIDSTVAALREIEDVLLVEYNFTVKTTAMANYEECDESVSGNKLLNQQWHLNYCGIAQGNRYLTNPGGSPNVIVAVIDTGVDINHEDLKDNIYVNENEIPDNGRDDDKNGYIDDYYGVNIISGIGNGNDDNGHGTHVAGIIAAQNNNLGTVGIAYNTKIMPIKAAQSSGTLNQSDIAKAVYYAYEHGAEVINMSFGGVTCSAAVQDALKVAYSRCVLVASAGNDGKFNEELDTALPNYPAALSYVLGVMSVGRTGVESSFSSYDKTAYSGLEYELYAPGEEIISTVPGNKYASWSGTSMAAPMVSAIAALIRSQFNDKNTYSTKFIYGQLTSTSSDRAVCVGHADHGIGAYCHHVPFIINLIQALRNLPKPQLGMSDYYVFDTAGFESDTENHNNGDGVVDAGETIALGLTLRNKWGSSENTIVSIDCTTVEGYDERYVEIVNPSVSYGSVGTYMSKDCGKLYEDEVFTGWEEPFYIKISKDCPNEYKFNVNVTIRCENGIDFLDDDIYTTTAQLTITVRNGYVLPSIIEEDMTLTPDNLYIIPNSTTIKSGVTVRVEPGTRIQFWSNDASDPYADDYIAFLRVEGNFIAEGTAENPVYIYPSKLMKNYRVEIDEVNDGYVSISHADVTNLFDSNISNLSDSIFRKSTSGEIYYRYISGGKVHNSSTSGSIGLSAKNTVFYKINGSWGGTASAQGTYDSCLFLDCAINYSSARLRNCVLYGNTYNEDGYFDNSSYTLQSVYASDVSASDVKIYYVPETGTTYLSMRGNNDSTNMVEYLKRLGYSYAVFETEAELDGVNSAGVFTAGSYDLGIEKRSGAYYWSDGTVIGDFIDASTTTSSNPPLDLSSKYLYNYSSSYYLFEIKGDIYATDISFSEFDIAIDLETEYQINAITAPIPFEASELIFESKDEAVATVDKNGLVTPVAKGKTEIYVYSKDKAVYNYIDVSVVDYVALEDFDFRNPPAEIEVGTSCNLVFDFSPVNTTRKNVKFSSSAPEIISVNASGIITANARGEAVITAELEGITKKITVYSYKKAESISMNANSEIVLCLSDKTAALPEIIHGDSDVRITWASTDESVLSVKNGRIKLNSSGVAILRATDERTGYAAEIKIYVSTDNELHSVVKVEGNHNLASTYALTEDGDVVRMSNGEIVFTDVKDISCEFDRFFLLKHNGEILYGISDWYYDTITSLKNVKKVIAGNGTYFAITEEGFAYSWGYNYGNCSGTGIIGTINSPALVNLENVSDIYSTGGESQITYFLCSDGSLYCVGDNIGEALPVLIKENVTAIDKTGYSDECMALIDGRWYYMYSDGRLESAGYYYDTDGRNPGFTVIDGIPYHLQDSYKYRIGNIINAVDVIGVYGNTYIICEDGSVFAYGYYVTGTSREKPALLPLFNYSKKSLALESTSLENGTVLKNDSLVLDFNGKITAAAGVLYADGVQVPFRVTVDLDKAVYTPVNGFREGVSYEMTIPVSNVSSPYLNSMESEIRLQFTYESVISEEPSTEEITTEEVITEEETTEELIPELPSLEEETTEAASEEETTVAPEIEETEPEKVTFREAMLDESVERYYVTVDEFVEKMNYLYDTFNPYFYGNVILNRISTDFDGDNWLRIIAYESSTYKENPVGYNYWGTTNETAIGLQLVDFTDFQIYQKLEYKPFLETAPENVFPFITDVKIFNEDGEEVKTAGNEEITVRVTFNRDMDESIPLSVRFGDIDDYMAGSVLKVDYTVTGDYVDARTWEGSIYLSTLMNNGNHYFTIANGKAKDADLYFYEDAYRFGLEIDTTAAQALIMQGTATDEGVELSWSQDDFDTLMGYNVYRSESEDGYYQKLNSSVIPDDTKTFFDDTVEPGKVYYYNFTVVKTDLTESTPSGKISIISKDTMAPDIYHTPVYSAKTGANLIISATVSDNLGINNSVVYYRTTGDAEWKMAVMNNLNDKYSVIISADEISIEGFEYYIEAFDGINYTYKGSAENPYVVSVQQSLDDDALGDVNGDGKISNIDALMLLQAINDMLNLTEEQFERADLNGDGELAAAEALRILHYVSGSVGSVKM